MTDSKKPNGSLNELDQLAESFGLKPMFNVAAERQVIDLIYKDDSRSLKERFAMLEVDDFTDQACREAFLKCQANYERSQPGLSAEITERQGSEEAGEAVLTVIRHRMRREVQETVPPVLGATYSDGDLPSAIRVAVKALDAQLRRWRTACAS